MAYKQKLTFGLIVATRNIFNAKLAIEARSVLLDKISKSGHNALILPSGETPSGNIETLQDARKCAKFFSDNRDIIDGIIVVLPNFGDEIGVVNSLNLAKLDVPVLIQACDDDNDKVGVYSRRDAFCGKISVCNNLYQYGIPFTDTTYHTYPLESEQFDKDIEYFARVCRVTNGLRNARIGAIGARPAAFQTMRYSEKILQANGITIVPVDLSEIIASAEKFDANSSEHKEKVGEIREYGKIPSRIKQEQVNKLAAFNMAIENWVAKNEVDATAIQCWESVQKNYGCATCTVMSMMGEKFQPSACEVDVAGAISMYALLLASGSPPAILDWNNNFGTDRNMCVCTHCSNYPKSFMQSDIEISTLDILGTVLGHEDTFGAIKGKVAPGPFTFFRISTDDTSGTIKAYIGEGEFTADPYAMDGGIAVSKVNNLQALLKFICKNGFEHHVAMTRGNVVDAVEEAVDSYLGWDLYRHL
ncbi:MAG: L-fucose/L-arabinose isomerase family protein [Bacteroidales bacterium]